MLHTCIDRLRYHAFFSILVAPVRCSHWHLDNLFPNEYQYPPYPKASPMSRPRTSWWSKFPFSLSQLSGTVAGLT
ncbi:hypothetical protein B0H66DRAFT_260473 [Apodospora peruviana]|uniref:Uncharacterized protein n=1 Tax=Apodospora peruviana TaxID=516989 RepID=A0AAE0I7Q7_9PEZI|nr:hypothetical protein B0H66DRAFT_260473 [Apodospora peruviana]